MTMQQIQKPVLMYLIYFMKHQWVYWDSFFIHGYKCENFSRVSNVTFLHSWET